MSSLRMKSAPLLLVLLLPVVLMAGRNEHERLDVDAEGAERIEVTIEFGAGEMWLTSADFENVLEMEATYDPRIIDFDHDYQVSKGVGELFLESSLHRKHDIDADNHRWEMTLSRNYPMSLDLEVGACEAEMDLGGLQLEGLKFDVGAASAEIDFSAPNPIPLGEIEIEAGAASLVMREVGNANFEQLSFTGGVGSFELDLRGEYTGESEVTIEVGLGSMNIILPRNLPIRVVTDGGNWFSSIGFHRDRLDEVDDNEYETEDFRDAETRIILNVEVGLGSIDLYWKK